jgi:hypothetical protein
MRSILLVAAILSSALVLGGASGLTPRPPVRVYGNAPIGHLQPHARNFFPGSAVEQTEQDRMSNFDAEQHKMDEELDKSLNICRC